MKFAATTLIALLGTTSIAVADPDAALDVHATAKATFGWQFGYGSDDVVRDHRYPADRGLPGYRRPIRPAPSQWMNLGTISNGARQWLTSSAFDGSRFDSLTFSVRGRVHVEQLYVRFANGQSQTIRLGRTLIEGSQMPILDLAGDNRAIQGIFVYTGSNRMYGQLTVFGRDDRRMIPRPDPRPMVRWSTLGSVSTGKQTLKLDTGAHYSVIGLSATGSVRVRQILIRFADGQQQLAKLDMMVNSRTAMQVLDLAGNRRAIRSIIVYSDPQSFGDVTVHAR